MEKKQEDRDVNAELKKLTDLSTKTVKNICYCFLVVLDGVPSPIGNSMNTWCLTMIMNIFFSISSLSILQYFSWLLIIQIL
ncbi:hypothetical protein M153_19700012050 [Pseudoloma neurophilia]|uniref:Uncharacterized protein n=1 Tax=Pseudoloma neurophilia TaxID=146866 RepID=A0A0R0LZU1_9MICR|nr:hypothetical protein M153_19700012050 [Pseudoloma neurophilia]